MLPASTPHITVNTHACEVRSTVGKGRGVFAAQPLPPLTTIDTSPVLLLSPEEIKHTLLAHYTFTWRDGRQALALGLGSLFNHSAVPNVSYTLDTKSECIRYTTVRRVEAGEELCIFYGRALWFDDADNEAGSVSAGKAEDEDEDAWEQLAAVELHDVGTEENELVSEQELPFEKVKVTDEHDEDADGSVIKTVDAWVVDLPDPRKTANMIQWLKQEGLEHPSLKHTKQVRKWTDPETSESRTTLLIGLADTPPPSVPDDLTPYIAPVPQNPARTLEQVKLKGEIWPVFLEARNHAEERADAQRWTRGTVQWFRDAVSVLRREAKRARECGELPIVSYVPTPYDAPHGMRSFIVHDTRTSTQHPLRHSIFNLIRLAGDSAPEDVPAENGHNYLLTSRILFTTHEPCIACSMALLHSRVKEVVYLYAMPKTGGCGSVACVPGLKGVNHRYKLWRWRGLPPGGGIQDIVDA